MIVVLLMPLVSGVATASAASAGSAQVAKLSSVSILGYYQYKNPQSAAWYLSRFGKDFSAFQLRPFQRHAVRSGGSGA